MKAPLCRVCGMAHWGGDHIWPKAIREAITRNTAVAVGPDNVISLGPCPVNVVTDPPIEAVMSPGLPHTVVVNWPNYPILPPLEVDVLLPKKASEVVKSSGSFMEATVEGGLSPELPVSVAPIPTVEEATAPAAKPREAKQQASLEERKAQSREYMRAYRERQKAKKP